MSVSGVCKCGVRSVSGSESGSESFCIRMTEFGWGTGGEGGGSSARGTYTEKVISAMNKSFKLVAYVSSNCDVDTQHIFKHTETCVHTHTHTQTHTLSLSLFSFLSLSHSLSLSLPHTHTHTRTHTNTHTHTHTYPRVYKLTYTHRTCLTDTADRMGRIEGIAKFDLSRYNCLASLMFSLQAVPVVVAVVAGVRVCVRACVRACMRVCVCMCVCVSVCV